LNERKEEENIDEKQKTRKGFGWTVEQHKQKIGDRS